MSTSPGYWNLESDSVTRIQMPIYAHAVGSAPLSPPPFSPVGPTNNQNVSKKTLKGTPVAKGWWCGLSTNICEAEHVRASTASPCTSVPPPPPPFPPVPYSYILRSFAGQLSLPVERHH